MSDHFRRNNLLVSGPHESIWSLAYADLLSRTLSAGMTLTFIAVALVTILSATPAFAATLEKRVATGSDDAEENASGSVSLNSSDLELVFDRGSNQTVGIRFTGLDIPVGANIQRAYIQFDVDETNSDATFLSIQGESSDSAATFTSSSNNISSRALTFASVSWAPPAWSTVHSQGLDQQTPDLSAVVQEIVSRPGWNSGNALAFVITGSGERTAEAYNGTAAAAPLLHVEYSTGTPINQTPEVEAGPNQTIALPVVSVSLGDASVTDDGLPTGGTLVQTWARVGGTGAGFVTFTNAGEVNPIVTFSQDPGTYVLALTAADGELQASDTVTITLLPESTGTTTIEKRVSASADDAEENSSGSVSLSSSDLELVFDRSSNQVVGIRFTNLDIPNGAFIEQAYIQFDVDEANTGATFLTIQGQASDTATNFTSGSYDISSRPRTSSMAFWEPPDWTTVHAQGPDQQTPDLSTVVQEIVGRPGWNNGNAIAFIITGSGERTAESFNGTAAAAPMLHVEFSGDPTNQPPMVDAGADAGVTLPNATVFLEATVTDDGLPNGTLTTAWNHVGGTGGGMVSFADPGSVDTTATFTADPGTYVLRLTANDSVLSSSDEVTITVNPDGVAALDRQIAASSDDAEERVGGSVTLTSSDLELVNDRGGNQTVGMRFNAINILPGSIVTNAYIQFTVDESTSVATNLTIEGEANNNASTFTNSTFNISSRPRTVTNQAWSPPPWPTVGQAGPDQRSPNIAGIVHEIVNRPGWSSGNSLVILITGIGERVAESYNGVSAAAPRLHVEFGGQTTNQPPVVNAGADISLTLPGDTVLLDGMVTDDGRPSASVITVWSHAGGTGTGVVTFGDPSAVETTATITPDLGTYVLRLSANDGELSTYDELTVTLREGGEVIALTQVNHFDTGFDNNGNPLTIPSIDPAGLVYHEPFDRLFITDSEINEVSQAWSVVGASLFEASASGSNLFDQWDLTQQTGNEPLRNREPTGITFCPGDAHFYISNDDMKLIYRYAYDGSVITAVDAISTQPHTNDPEGITCDPANGRLYVIGGAGINILVYRYNAGFELVEVLDLVATAGTPAGVPSDAEGIAFDPVSGHLFVVSSPDRAIFEYTSSGVFVKKFNIGGFSPRPVNPQGLSIGPSSANSQAMSIYIADGGVDNDQDPNERDGRIYEAEIQRAQ